MPPSAPVRTQALKAVAEVSEATASATEPHDLLGKVADVIRQHFALDYVGYTCLMKSIAMRCLGRHGRSGCDDAGQRLATPCWWGLDDWPVCRLGRAHRYAACDGSGGAPGNPLLPNIESEAAVPIRYGTGILGAITAQSRARDAFGDVGMVTLRAVADLVAVALRASTPRDRDGLPGLSVTTGQRECSGSSGAVTSLAMIREQALSNRSGRRCSPKWRRASTSMVRLSRRHLADPARASRWHRGAPRRGQTGWMALDEVTRS